MTTNLQDGKQEIQAFIREIIIPIKRWVQFNAYYNEIPGIGFALQQYDTLLIDQAWGLSNIENKEKMTNTTMFRIASHSKLFTASAIMELYAEEKLSLDDKVTKHLSWFQPKEDNIRIKHLLTHSSGLTRDAEFGQWYNHKFPNMEEFKEIMQGEVEILDPAVQIKYSNIAFTLLGLIIEKVSGLSYEDYMFDLVDRLGLQKTFPNIGDNSADHATGYSMRMPNEERESYDHIEAKVMDAATGFSSIPSEILRFYRAQMIGQNRGLKYGDYFKREMQNLQFKYKDNEWGLGFIRINVGGWQFLGHSGGYPGFITFSAFNPDRELSIAIFTNTLNPPNLFGGMVGLLKFAENNYDKFGSNDDYDGLSEKIPDFAKYEGMYRGRWGVYSVSVFHDKLLIIPLSIADPAAEAQRLKWIKDDTFVAEEASPGAGKGEKVYFRENEMETRGMILERFQFDY